jgi:uncharacterized protein with PQ loop repeat
MLDYLPIVAAGFGIPQYLPQILKLRRTRDPAGVSWSWAMLTSLNNGAWFVYFILSEYWSALVPSSAATLLAGVLATMLTARRRAVAPIAAWAALLVAGYIVAGRNGLGTLLTAAFVIQVSPSIWTAYRTRHPTGISRGTWTLVLGELTCWATYGLDRSDPRLIVLGFTGIAASILMLARIPRDSAPELTAQGLRRA